MNSKRRLSRCLHQVSNMKINESQLRNIIREAIMDIMEEYNGGDLGQELKQILTGELDYLYNEGVVAYDDNHLAAIARGTMKPDYDDLAKATISDYRGQASNEAIQILETFVNGGDEYDEGLIDLMDDIFEGYAAKNGFSRQ